MKNKTVIISAIILIAIFIRFYNFSDRITFGPEQAMSLITSGRMVTEKFSLLGNQNAQRATSAGHSLFSGALFNYSLIPLQIVFNYNPLPITAYFTLLNILTGFIVYWVAKKMFDEKAGIFSMILFLFSGLAIYHSLFIWNQNYIFLLGIISFYLLFKLIKGKSNRINIFELGLLCGVGISVQDLYVITALIVLVLILIYLRNKPVSFLVFGLGAAIPNLPAIIFDLKHNFYYVNTAWTYFIESLGGRNSPSLAYYHFLQFVPVLAVLIGWLLAKLYTKRPISVIAFLVVYIYFNLTSSLISFDGPTGMPKELTIKNIYKAAESVSNDSPKSYNVAVLVDFDTRGHILRYPMEFKYRLKPLDVTQYSNAQQLYVLAENSYDFEHPGVWELSSFYPYQYQTLATISDNYSIFKLTK